MTEVDLALQDKSQQKGNLDEAAVIARMKRLVMWLGDHRQTLGGLRKSDAARLFRRKLLRRPVALRGNTEGVQPNMTKSSTVISCETSSTFHTLKERIVSQCVCTAQWREINDAATRRRHNQHDANTGPTPDPNYKREPFATHPGKNPIARGVINDKGTSVANLAHNSLTILNYSSSQPQTVQRQASVFQRLQVIDTHKHTYVILVGA